MYYPKSQIKTNQYTNGDDFVIGGRNYVGDYYETSDGRFFTGKSPSNPPNKLLTPNIWTVPGDGDSLTGRDQDFLTNFPSVVFVSIYPQ